MSLSAGTPASNSDFLFCILMHSKEIATDQRFKTIMQTNRLNAADVGLHEKWPTVQRDKSRIVMFLLRYNAPGFKRADDSLKCFVRPFAIKAELNNTIVITARDVRAIFLSIPPSRLGTVNDCQNFKSFGFR